MTIDFGFDDAAAHDAAAREAAAARMPATCRAVGAHAAGAVFLLDEVGSTNTFARDLVREGRIGPRDGDDPVVAVVAADTQSAGRGRLDHTWVSRPGESFTVSFAVDVPRAIATDESVNGWLQMIAGLATLDAIDDALAIAGARPLPADDAEDARGAGRGQGGVAFAVSGPTAGPRLKWPNDLYLAGRKLGGILAEMVAMPMADAPAGPESDDRVADARVVIVYGIGLNLYVPADRLPTGEATSLQLAYGPLPSADGLRDAIAAGVVRSMRRRLSLFAADPGRVAALLLRETRERSWMLGRRVVAHFIDGTAMEGEAEDVNLDASLLLRTDDDALHVVRTADVGVLAQ